MSVLRIVANLPSPDPKASTAFYRDILGLDIAMDQGWIMTFAAQSRMTPQVSVASEGGAGSMLPNISVEVDNLDEVFARAVASGYEIVYPITEEAWGVRRFYVRDPSGNVVNVLTHG